MAAHAKPINLLPTSSFESSFWGKFLKWAITSGRYIIIATEMVVILAFLSRFKLDQDLADITDTIKGQEALLMSQKPIEEEFRLTQKRLDAVGTMISTQINSSEVSQKLISNIPAEIKLTSLVMQPGMVTIQAKTLSEQAIGLLLARLGQEPKWKEMEMTDFSTSDGTEIIFTLILRN